MGSVRKYNDDFSRETARKLLGIFSGSFKKLRDYKFDGSDPNHLLFQFYVPIITHDSGHKNQLLLQLLSFLEKSRSRGRIYIDQGSICIEVTVPRPRTTTGV